MNIHILYKGVSESPSYIRDQRALSMPLHHVAIYSKVWLSALFFLLREGGAYTKGIDILTAIHIFIKYC